LENPTSEVSRTPLQVYNMPEGLTTSIPKALYLLDGELSRRSTAKRSGQP
jgi:hypothetical protein